MEWKNDMMRHLAERFSAHEVPAPHGAWEAISSQLTLSAAASADGVNELFRDRFAEHAMDAPPSAWSHVSGQLGHGAAGGWGAVAAWAGAGIAALVLTGTLVWVTHEEPLPSNPVASTSAPAVQPVSPAVVAPNETAPITSIVTTGQPGAVQPNTTGATGTPNPIALIRQEMQEQANEEPLMPVERVADPRLMAEDRQVLLPPVVGQDAPPAEVKAPTNPAPTTHTEDHPIEQPTGIDPMETDVTEQVEPRSFTLYMPNVFTPNGDGRNDLYLPEGEGHVELKIRVYSMTNNQQLVFSAEERRGWDGTYFNGGQACPEGMYLVAVEVVDQNGKAHAEGQVVNLLR